MSRTVSCRIPKELHELLSEHCNNEGMTINDYIKDAIDKRFHHDALDENTVILKDKNNIKFVREKMNELGSDDEDNRFTPDDVFSMLTDYSNDVERLESLLEEKNQKIRHLEIRPANYEEAFLHITDCNRCRNAIIDNGHVLVSLDELKKYNLVPMKNPD